MTDPRDRLSTDPGIGPVDLGDKSATLRPLEIVEEEVYESPDVSVYCEPKPLVAASEHRTLEIATVKLAQDIDPRRLPTEVRGLRTPSAPRVDSGWPQADLVLTSSQRPAAPPRRWRGPVALFALLGALLLLVVARGASQRKAAQVDALSAARRAQPTPAAPVALARVAPSLVAPTPVALTAPPVALTAPPVALTAPSAVLTPAPSAASSSASGVSAARSVHVAPAKPTHTPVVAHAVVKPSSASLANGPAVSESTPAKPKRAIY